MCYKHSERSRQVDSIQKVESATSSSYVEKTRRSKADALTEALSGQTKKRRALHAQCCRRDQHIRDRDQDRDQWVSRPRPRPRQRPGAEFETETECT
ncbi:hypothetical protein HOLleu_06252 [Holothuria leucospilota]|uniref:Uncharacterized protein n=1 Tax=Holothuria leucospilota TaxID=206669 RepID=A0A9Q1CMT1_HOLLE|nr:hypothetical protein HOLleu_06252 [Holothuria leucospilota]